MYGIVYKVTNTVNGHFYIGQTKTRFSSRWSKHCQDARNGAGWVMAAAIRKYGPGAFTHEIIEECEDRDSLNAAEVKHIVTLRPHYNAMGGGGQLGSPSMEVRAKISLAGKGKIRSTETRSRMSAGQMGHPVADSTRELLRNSFKGKVLRKLPIQQYERDALAARNKARRIHAVDTTLEQHYAEVGATTRNEKIRASQKRNHANNPGRVRGRNNPMFGRVVPEALKRRYAEMFTGEGNPFFGKTHTDDTRAKMIAAHAAREPVVCPHCGKAGHVNAMKRWHFSNCRSSI